MTNEQYEQLKPFESWMYSATRADYIRNLSSQGVDLFAQIYRSLFGTAYPINRNCPACILKLVKIVGNKYYEYEQEAKANSSRNQKARRHEKK